MKSKNAAAQFEPLPVHYLRAAGRSLSQASRRVIRRYFRSIGLPHRIRLCTYSIPYSKRD